MSEQGSTKAVDFMFQFARQGNRFFKVTNCNLEDQP